MDLGADIQLEQFFNPSPVRTRPDHKGHQLNQGYQKQKRTKQIRKQSDGFDDRFPFPGHYHNFFITGPVPEFIKIGIGF
jgi:hypothetical protein